MAASGFYKNIVIGELRPPAQVVQWDIRYPSPSGDRHIESGAYVADARIGWVGGFQAQNEPSGVLDFGSVYYEENGCYSDLIPITVNMGEINYNIDSFFDQLLAQSGVHDNFKLFNIKLWLENNSAFSGINSTVYYKTDKNWLHGQTLNEQTSGVLPIPTSLPSAYNVPIGYDSRVYASGAFRDDQVSEFVYLFIHFSGGVTLGTYGSQSLKDFRFRVTYDWTDWDASILATDID